MSNIYYGNQDQESVINDEDDDFEDYGADEDTTMGSPTGEKEV